MEFMEFGDMSTTLDEEMLDIDSNAHYAKFDTTVGIIEDVIMSNEFQTLQNNFCDKYSNEFDETEENKFVYTDIHKEYTESIEAFLVNKLKEEMPDFSMEEFSKELGSRELDLDEEGEIFEILFSFSDFLVFKEMMVAHRKSKDNPGLFDDLVSVTPLCRETGGQQSNDPNRRVESALQMSGLSIQCSPSSSGGRNREPAKSLIPKLTPRPNSSRGVRKLPTTCPRPEPPKAATKPVAATTTTDAKANVPSTTAQSSDLTKTRQTPTQ